MSSKFLLETEWDVTPDNTSSFEIYNPDDQYILGNATDNMQKYDGTNFVDLEGSPPKGNILAVYKDRLMIAGDSSFPHRVWFSNFRNGEGWSKDTDWIDIYPEDGGKINGFAIQADELIVSKDNGRLYGWMIFDDGIPENSRLRVIEDDKGFVNSKARTVIDNTMYYQDRERLDTVPISVRGGVSYVVQEIIQGVENFTNTAMGSNDGRVYVALGDITVELGDSVTLNDTVLVYDTINQAFYLRDNVDAKVFSKLISTTGQESLYFGDTSGRVFEMNSGNLAGSNPINMRIRTKPYFRDLGNRIHVRKVGIYMDDPDGTVVNYRTNLNEKFVNNLGSVIREPVEWFSVNSTGPLFQLELTHSNVNARPRLLAVEIEYAKQGKKE